VPDHPLATELLKVFGGPVAAPSANPSGRISPTTAEHVLRGLDGRIEAVLDGGPTSVGVESTILGLADGRAHLLRAGGVPVEALEAAIGAPLARLPQSGRITAPGQLASHYAPGAPVRLDATEGREGELFIGFGAVPGEMTLSASGDLREAAARLFEVLHAADADGRPIAVAPIPETGLGQAINDRLRRAAAPR
jgi:L-threonylcarbamoyladenylate synthase